MRRSFIATCGLMCGARQPAIVQCLLARDVEGAKTLLQRHIRKSAEAAKAITLTQLAQQRIRAHSN